MIPFKDFDESKLDKYSIENLRMFINEIEMKRSESREKRLTEMAECLSDERFDAYSFFGKRKLRKIAKKYDGSLAGAEIYLKMIQRELSKREDEEEIARYSGRSIVKQKQISEEEFLQKEQDKTWAYRSKIE